MPSKKQIFWTAGSHKVNFEVDPIEPQHQLEILDMCLIFIKLDTQKIKVRYSSWKTYNKVRHVPYSASYLTVRQLQFILAEIQKNYLSKTHAFFLNGDHFLVKIYDPNKPEDFPEISAEGDR